MRFLLCVFCNVFFVKTFSPLFFQKVCGTPVIDVDFLRDMTVYENCCSTDEHIKFLWTILKDRFDDAERVKFLEFVWGRYVRTFSLLSCPLSSLSSFLPLSCLVLVVCDVM